jgi:hypothetical protein
MSPKDDHRNLEVNRATPAQLWSESHSFTLLLSLALRTMPPLVARTTLDTLPMLSALSIRPLEEADHIYV